jgi:hypothetical protein
MHARRAIAAAAVLSTLAAAGAAPSSDVRNATSNPPTTTNANEPAPAPAAAAQPVKGARVTPAKANRAQRPVAVRANTPANTKQAVSAPVASTSSATMTLQVQPVRVEPFTVQCTTGPANAAAPAVNVGGKPSRIANNAAKPANAPARAAQGVGTMDPQVAQGLERWMKANSPGEAHKGLEFFVGTWNARVVYSNFPGVARVNGANAEQGKVVTSWTHGNRFLRSEFTGGVGGAGFTATSTIGFNNAAGRFEGTWIDSSSTGVRASTGTSDQGGKVYTFTSTFPDPVTGATTTFKEVFTIESDRAYTHQVFEVGTNKSEHRIQEVNYTRQ